MGSALSLRSDFDGSRLRRLARRHAMPIRRVGFWLSHRSMMAAHARMLPGLAA